MQGLDKLKKLIETLKQMPKKAKESADAAMVNNSADFVELNRAQLRAGVDSESSPLKYKRRRKSPLNPSGAYTDKYARKKQKLGGQASYVDLNQTGSFLKSLKLDHESLGRFRIKSDQAFGGYYGNFSLEEELLYNYGENILGVNDTRMKWFMRYKIQPDVEIRIQNILNRI